MLSRQFLTGVRLSRALPEDSYVSSLPVVRHMRTMELLPLAPVTILVGENGVGKSTLLEAVAVAAGLNPEGGSTNFQFAMEPRHDVFAVCGIVAHNGDILRQCVPFFQNPDYRLTTNAQR